MKLIGIVIEECGNLFKEQIFNFSDEYKINYCFKTRELEVVNNEEYISGFYSDQIYNITPIVGVNGAGKTTLLDLIYYYTSPSKKSIKDSKFFRVYQQIDETFILEVEGVNGIKRKGNNIVEVGIPPEKASIKNCSIVRDNFILGTYGGSNFSDVIFNKDDFPNIVKAYELLSNINIIKSDFNLVLYSYYYGFGSRYEKYKEAEGLERFIYGIIFKLLEDPKFTSILDKEFKIDVKEKKTYDEILNKISEISNTNVVVNSIIKYLRSIIIELKKLKEKGRIIEGNEAILLNASKNKVLEFDIIYKKFIEFDEVLKKHNIFSKTLYDMELGMSTGERNIITVVSYIYEIFETNKTGHWILVADEIEVGLHLEWSRKLVSSIIEVIKEMDSEFNNSNNLTFQFIFTTHSPFLLSDIKPGNVIALKKVQDYSTNVNIGSSFAKNLLEIMHNDLFIEYIYGEFATDKIDTLIGNLQKDCKENLSDDAVILINSIGEPLLRHKLQSMYKIKEAEVAKIR